MARHLAQRLEHAPVAHAAALDLRAHHALAFFRELEPGSVAGRDHREHPQRDDEA